MAEDYIEINRALWNAKTPVHIDSEFYDNTAFKGGKNSLNPAELEAFGEVQGKSLLHLQCHFGQDTLSWARMGAEVTGIDLSDASIEAARGLAKELGVSARFIRSNVYDTSSHLGNEQFDLVFTSYGCVCWLPDLSPWAKIIARHLKPGGKFCIVDFHPAYMMYEFDDMELTYSYFNTGPIIEETEGSYAERDAEIKNRSYSWNHPFSEVIGALLGQGLNLQDFTEYPYSYYDCFPGLEKKDGNYVLVGKGAVVPLMYRLVFEK